MGFEQLAPLKAQFVKQRESQQTKQRPKTSKSTQQTPVDPVVVTIALLQKHFPLAFPKKPAAKVALKIGIHKDLIEHAETLGITAGEIRLALKKWCQGKRYAECMIEGAVRVDLQGQASGVVTKEEAAHFENNNRRSTQGHQPSP